MSAVVQALEPLIDLDDDQTSSPHYSVRYGDLLLGLGPPPVPGMEGPRSPLPITADHGFLESLGGPPSMEGPPPPPLPAAKMAWEPDLLSHYRARLIWKV
jgi:hypothetical protein